MKKHYRVLLNEEFLEPSQQNSVFKGTFVNKPVVEIASSDSSYSWQASNLLFQTKINGTHELSFNLAKYYFDIDTAEQKENEIIDYLDNKCTVEVQKEDRELSPDENGEIIYKSYFMTVNKKEEKDEQGLISYNYTCSDAYIEELSKTGYQLTFDEDSEKSRGTIHELSQRVAEGSDWIYRKDLTGTLQEYIVEPVWNEEQQRFDEIQKPVPTHRGHYIPELKWYSNQLEVCATVTTESSNTYYQPIYSYISTETITGSIVKNMLYNTSEFVDTTGWGEFKKTNLGKLQLDKATLVPIKSNTKDEYYLKYNTTEQGLNYIYNDTMSSAQQVIEADTPYIFYYTLGTDVSTPVFSQIYLDDRVPYKEGIIIQESKYSMRQEAENHCLKPNTYYVVRSSKRIYNPYLILSIDDNVTNFQIKDIALYPLKGKTAEDNAQLLLLADGEILNTSQLNMAINLEEIIKEPYLAEHQFYFSRDNYRVSLKSGEDEKIDEFAEDTITYYTFNEVNKKQYCIKRGHSSDYLATYFSKPIVSCAALPSNPQLNTVYLKTSDNKYYQYYQLTKNGITNGSWDYALYGDGVNDKIRSLIASKSNRFNLIQEISELFKVWPVFQYYRDEDGTIHKEFWFKETAIKENFAGFHKGVNLAGLTRQDDSDEVVTKIFVEDIENSSATDGIVSIVNSKYNPWGERYFYNFTYYINHNLINKKVPGTFDVTGVL